ncbi:hypothetical protein G4B88_025315 [Cannabis sativa]|uniref:Non-haem dioxygenase N-terminal domain-containing protein n=1 Tax=Cannabis sativa TaxID=3483 RepID=A0A7J6HSS7_CANSA|nr:hypothetical protein G4B88_025315 [Cannabis sativa]
MGTEFDPAFIQAPEHRPKPTILEAQGIPLIDLSTGPIDDLARRSATPRKWGFFQVINHGVSPESRRKIESARGSSLHATRCATRLKRIDKGKAIVQSKVEGGKQLMKTFEPIVKDAKKEDLEVTQVKPPISNVKL